MHLLCSLCQPTQGMEALWGTGVAQSEREAVLETSRGGLDAQEFQQEGLGRLESKGKLLFKTLVVVATPPKCHFCDSVLWVDKELSS